jgi:hypothetical protein
MRNENVSSISSSDFQKQNFLQNSSRPQLLCTSQHLHPPTCLRLLLAPPRVLQAREAFPTLRQPRRTPISGSWISQNGQKLTWLARWRVCPTQILEQCRLKHRSRLLSPKLRFRLLAQVLKPVGFPPRLERSVNVGSYARQARSYLPREKCKHRWGEGKKEGNMMKLNMVLEAWTSGLVGTKLPPKILLTTTLRTSQQGRRVYARLREWHEPA